MKLPLDLDEACRLAVQGTRAEAIELAGLDDRPFVNVASAGLPGPAARTAQAWKGRWARSATRSARSWRASRRGLCPCR